MSIEIIKIGAMIFNYFENEIDDFMKCVMFIRFLQLE